MGWDGRGRPAATAGIYFILAVRRGRCWRYVQPARAIRSFPDGRLGLVLWCMGWYGMGWGKGGKGGAADTAMGAWSGIVL